MDNSLILYSHLAKSLAKDFDIEETQLTEHTLTSIQSKLTAIIKFLLDKDMGQLMNILYRIDVNESKIAKILSGSPVENIAEEITDLVIERQMQKIITRMKYEK